MTENRQHFSNIYDVTQVKFKEFIYTWKIFDFKYISTGDVLYAPITEKRVQNKEELWAVYVYRDGRTDQDADYISVEVTFFGNNKELEHDTLYCLSISIIDINGKEYEAYISTGAEKGTEITIDNFMKKDFMLDEKNGLLPNGDLTLRFKAYFTEEFIDNPPLAKPASRLNEPTFLGLESILYDKKFSDAKIIAGDKDFYVYKGILASRSPVFADMFAKDVEEKSIEDVVKITDMKYETMQEVLRFIYTGKVNNIRDIASDLLIAADKYQIEELKLLCEEDLINNVNVENVTGLLIHAEKYKAKNLKTIALDFFKFHAKEIIKNKTYKADLKNLLPVLPDIFEVLI